MSVKSPPPTAEVSRVTASTTYDEQYDAITVTPDQLTTTYFDDDLGFCLSFYYRLPEVYRVRFWKMIAEDER